MASSTVTLYAPAAGDKVSYSQTLATGTPVGTITINGVDTVIYAPAGSSGSSGSSGGSEVSFTPTYTDGLAIGTITINGSQQTLYIPKPVTAVSYTSQYTSENGVAIGTMTVETA